MLTLRICLEPPPDHRIVFPQLKMIPPGLVILLRVFALIPITIFPCATFGITFLKAQHSFKELFHPD
jgi:hypothetical protein